MNLETLKKPPVGGGAFDVVAVGAFAAFAGFGGAAGAGLEDLPNQDIFWHVHYLSTLPRPHTKAA